MKNLFIIIFLLGSFAAKAQISESDYKRNLNASLKLIQNTVEGKNKKNLIQQNNISKVNEETTTEKSFSNEGNKNGNVKSLKSYLSIDKIPNSIDNKNKRNIKVLKTEGGKTKLIQHNSIKPQSIDENGIRSLKALLKIPN
jgi:hypothetical protein